MRAGTGKGREKGRVRGMEEEAGKKERWKGRSEGHGQEMKNVIGVWLKKRMERGDKEEGR